mmetsp:Transcript_46863/g.118087  ORF Transcript_46863/g.118087 Transcript_46863/m.118087 type:complete len:474 (+) Transcript_46863:55-1476(+)
MVAAMEVEPFHPELDDVLRLGCFLMSLYAGSKLFSLLRVPALVGEIGVGVIWLVSGCLPEYLNRGLQVMGKLGLLVIVFEGGVGMDLAELRSNGVRAFVLGFMGMVLPIAVVGATLLLLGYPLIESTASGIVLSSTAIGFIMQLMSEAGMVATPMGRLVVSAAMIDDVLSIMLLSVLTALGSSGEAGGVGAWPIVRPLVVSVGILVACLVVRATIGKALQTARTCCTQRRLISHLPTSLSRRSDTSCIEVDARPTSVTTVQPAIFGYPEGAREEQVRQTAKVASTVTEVPAGVTWMNSVNIAILLSMGLGLALSWGAEALHSTYLLGAFMAGMVASAWPSFPSAWEHKTSQLLSWLVKIFFACSVGFQVPVEALLRARFRDVALLTVAAVIGKFASGLWAAPMCTRGCTKSMVQVGLAMVGRGEIGFLVAGASLRSGLLTEESHSATVWALMLATLLGPIMFQASLRLNGEDK